MGPHSLHDWAQRHGVSQAALTELFTLFGVHDTLPAAVQGTEDPRLEAPTMHAYRLAQSKLGVRLWRNNRGATYDQAGNFVRYGLANESSAMDKRLKSSDLIGITPITIQAWQVGMRVGVFTSREIKRPGWKYRGSAREQAQLAWLQLVISLGGLASFIDDPNK